MKFFKIRIAIFSNLSIQYVLKLCWKLTLFYFKNKSACLLLLNVSCNLWYIVSVLTSAGPSCHATCIMLHESVRNRFGSLRILDRFAFTVLNTRNCVATRLDAWFIEVGIFGIRFG